MTDFQWNRSYLATHKLKASGVIATLLLRYLYTSLFIYGVYHKVVKGWMWSDIMKGHFLKRFHELQAAALPGGSFDAQVAMFQASYLEHFAIPLVMPIAWIVTIGELFVGVAMLLGLTTRINAAFGLFLLLNFAAGGYYNITIPPLVTMSVLFIVLPTGHWLGLDRNLHLKHPDSPWFK
ncbi:MAG: DoxX family membrane protein [Chlorobiaceae bacterium]|nr:DoxX family membrane protein [Chlorobiaceae bacterium]